MSIDNLPINWLWAWIMSMDSFKAHCRQKRSFCCSLAGEIFRRVGSCEGMVIWWFGRLIRLIIDNWVCRSAGTTVSNKSCWAWTYVDSICFHAVEKLGEATWGTNISIRVSFKGKGHVASKRWSSWKKQRKKSLGWKHPVGGMKCLCCHPRLTDGNLKETHEQLVGKFDAGDTSTCFEFGVCVGQTRSEWRLFIAWEHWTQSKGIHNQWWRSHQPCDPINSSVPRQA